MTTKTKASSEDRPTPNAPVTGPVPPGLNDRREDGAPVVGHFVEVTEGDHEGFFGVFQEIQGDTCVVRSHNDVGYRVSVPYTSLKAAALHR